MREQEVGSRDIAPPWQVRVRWVATLNRMDGHLISPPCDIKGLMGGLEVLTGSLTAGLQEIHNWPLSWSERKLLPKKDG